MVPGQSATFSVPRGVAEANGFLPPTSAETTASADVQITVNVRLERVEGIKRQNQRTLRFAVEALSKNGGRTQTSFHVTCTDEDTGVWMLDWVCACHRSLLDIDM